MQSNDLLTRISINPGIRFGKPCIKGHRIWVSWILNYLAAGESIDSILEEYPGIELKDILACIVYGAEIARDGWAEVPLSDSS